MNTDPQGVATACRGFCSPSSHQAESIPTFRFQSDPQGSDALLRRTVPNQRGWSRDRDAWGVLTRLTKSFMFSLADAVAPKHALRFATRTGSSDMWPWSWCSLRPRSSREHCPQERSGGFAGRPWNWSSRRYVALAGAQRCFGAMRDDCFSFLPLDTRAVLAENPYMCSCTFGRCGRLGV